MNHNAAPLALLLLTASLAVPIAADPEIPGVTYTYPEGFESYLSGQSPSEAWYSVTETSGSANQAVNAISPITGNRDWRITDPAVAYAAQMGFTSAVNTNADLCTPGAVFSFSLKLDAAPTALSQIEFGIHASGAVSATG